MSVFATAWATSRATSDGPVGQRPTPRGPALVCDHLAGNQALGADQHHHPVHGLEVARRHLLVPDAVLGAEHRDLERSRAAESLHRRVHVVGLDGADDDVTLPERDAGDVGHRRHPEDVVAVDAAEVEALPVDRVHVLAQRIDEEHVEPGFGELAADHASDRPGPQHHESHPRSPLASRVTDRAPAPSLSNLNTPVLRLPSVAPTTRPSSLSRAPRHARSAERRRGPWSACGSYGRRIQTAVSWNTAPPFG